MYLKDGDEEDEEDEEGQAKDKVITLYLNSLEEGESTDKCFVDLEIAVYSWIGSVAQAPSALVRREDEYETLRILDIRYCIPVSILMDGLIYLRIFTTPGGGWKWMGMG
jgi:hypothetical protein